MSVAKLNEDIKTAMKEKDSEKLLALRTLFSDVKNVAIKAGRKEATDDDFLTAVNKAIKQRQDSAEQFRIGGRIELALVEETQLNLFKAYLPEQLSEAELEVIISETITSVGAVTKKDMGKVMKELSPKLKGKADMKMVNIIISGKLV
jgi:uncharacterized protein YqeY